MRTYYRGPDAHVTEDRLIWHTAPPQTFFIRELRDVGLVRSDRDGATPTAAQLTAGMVVVAAVGWPLTENRIVYAVGVALLSIATVLYGVDRRRRPRRWELRATYHERSVLLYASADDRTFNQVSRGLRRAIENLGPPSTWYQLASGK